MGSINLTVNFIIQKINMGDQILHKLVFIGDGASGKSCLINRLVNDQFDDQYEPTVFDEEKVFYEVSEDGSYNLSKTETKTSRVLRFVLKSSIIQALAPYRDQ